ncbi:alpha/beta fold hydrolase [Muricoccus vinaceus]|uniref:Alpha/beta fold hydrolase n=1 Tax=Muricoccus vinaceus TaxID=424704 RepID=A0ABV6IPK4_9PROT
MILPHPQSSSRTRPLINQLANAPPVVLGPSFLWDTSMWAPQIEALAARYRVIVPDLWGHGGSAALPPGTTTMRDLAQQHLTLLDRLNVGRCSIIGLSVGGMWGAELALMAPERVAGLVLMDTSLAVEPEQTRDGYFAMLGTVGAHGAVPEPVLDAVVPLFFSPTVRTRHPQLPETFRQTLRDWPPQRLKDNVAPLGRIIFGRGDLLADVASLSMPSLVMTGVDDLAQPVARGQAIAERIGCPFVAIPDAGHISSLEAPDSVNQALLDFLAGQDRRLA